MINADEKLVKQDAELLRAGIKGINAEYGNVMEVAGPGDDTSHQLQLELV